MGRKRIVEKREVVSADKIVLLKDLTIPAGTILREIGEVKHTCGYECTVYIHDDLAPTFQIEDEALDLMPDMFTHLKE